MGQFVGDRLEVLHRPAEPVEFGDDEGVARSEVVQGIVEAGAVGEGAGGVIGEQLLAARGTVNASICASACWSAVDTRRYPAMAIPGL